MAMRTRSELTVQYPDAAGIDVGGKNHCVAVPPGRCDTPVREFGGFTEDLHAMAAFRLALESTCVYWVPVFEVLEAHGIAVVLVNAHSVKNVSGLREWAGADLTRIGGIDVSTALKVLVELGPDLSTFASAKHFCSWLGLCPGTRISGGKCLSGASKRIPNRVARALKPAAQGLHHSQCRLGAYYRRMAARLGKCKAITATAHKLARLVYAMPTQGTEYVEQSQAQFGEKFQARTLKHLQQKAKSLGFERVPAAV